MYDSQLTKELLKSYYLSSSGKTYQVELNMVPTAPGALPIEFGLQEARKILPRHQRPVASNKIRQNSRGEVFTPAWMVNHQNNLLEPEGVVSLFNRESLEKKSWTATEEPIAFGNGYTFEDYVDGRVLEITCGEAPYLASSYDVATGEPIPLRDFRGCLQRVGLFDRKMRVVSENSQDRNWIELSLKALESVYGYEWQGDNLFLARMNLLASYEEYYTDRWTAIPNRELLMTAAKIISWRLIQMDGLKFVSPMSCSKKCQACSAKKPTGHDGNKPLVKIPKIVTLEELYG